MCTEKTVRNNLICKLYGEGRTNPEILTGLRQRGYQGLSSVRTLSKQITRLKHAGKIAEGPCRPVFKSDPDTFPQMDECYLCGRILPLADLDPGLFLKSGRKLICERCDASDSEVMMKNILRRIHALTREMAELNDLADSEIDIWKSIDEDQVEDFRERETRLKKQLKKAKG